MEEKKMVKTHRIGTITFGLVLIVFGLLFLLHMVMPNLSYLLVFRLWPLILISLGIEVLAGSRDPEKRFVYDAAAVFLLIILVLFAMGMAGMEWIFEAVESGKCIYW